MEYIEQYEESIKDLLKDLINEDLLVVYLPPEKINRLAKLVKSSDAATELYNNISEIVTSDTAETKAKLNELNDLGLKLDGWQILAIMCHSYQVTTEKLKLYLFTIIDFENMGERNAYRKSLGGLLYILKRNFQGNVFIQDLKTNIRNAVAHYSYYYVTDDKLYFCDGYYDPDPQGITLVEFMKESHELYLLTESFFCIYLDLCFPDDTI
ncbi:hypothetical protein KTG15_09190 [Methanobacterium sp. YSL]|nr:hypothetical protein [Methanobacterium sp. YSL]